MNFDYHKSTTKQFDYHILKNVKDKNKINMKNLIKCGFIAVVIFFYSCNGGTIKTENINDFATIIVEDCEYMYKSKVGYRSLVHKGNCKNPIHKCNCS